ncbi:hypothetical protein ACHAWF_009246 [Thalassiosira exigua]
MAAAVADPPTAVDSSPTGHEEFLHEEDNESSNKTELPSPSLEERKKLLEKSLSDAAEQASGIISDGAQEAQGLITSYFPPKTACTDSMKGSCGAEVPGLTASSSSEGSSSSKEKAKSMLSEWAEKLSSCHLDTACGKLDIEITKQEEEEASRGPALTERGELPQIEGPTPPKPWTEEISDRVQEAQMAATTASTKAMYALGFTRKKDQTLITDFYKPTKSEGETSGKSLNEKLQDAQTAVVAASTAAMSTMGLGECQTKGMVQRLITDYDPNRSAAAAAALTEEGVPDDVSVSTEPPSEKETKKKKSTWNIWKQLKGVVGKVHDKTPECTANCQDVSLPQVEILSCGESAPEVEVQSSAPLSAPVPEPKAGKASSMFSWVPKLPMKWHKKAKKEDAKKDEEEPQIEEPNEAESKTEESMATESKLEEPKLEEPKPEEAKPEEAEAEAPKTELSKADESKAAKPRAVDSNVEP